MKTPPFLLGAALLFWGWQTGFLAAGAVMAVLLEGARLVKTRWDFSDDDFSRIWTICTVLFLAAAIYAFTDNGGPAGITGFVQSPNFATQNRAGAASARTAAAMLRWLPMVLFLFVAAQSYSTREEIPVTTISLILRRRWKKAQKRGRPLPAVRGVNVSYPYFATCLFASSMHGSEDNSFFWGLCVLLPWALWFHRSCRFRTAIWAGVLGLALTGGYFGARGINQLQDYLQNLDARWVARLMRHRTDPTQSRTAIGQIGRIQLSGRIVIRLVPRNGSKPPEYLREASYRTYESPIWFADRARDDFELKQPEANGTTWNLLAEKTNLDDTQIACYLNGSTEGQPAGLLPLPSGCSRLENLPAFVLRMNSAGAVLAEGPGLLIFDALYGPGPTIDSPPSKPEDTAVPPDECLAIDQITNQLHLRTTNLEQVLHAVSGFFQDKFSYSLWQEPDNANGTGGISGRGRSSRRLRTRNSETPLSRFLLETRKGHCEYFATATVLLLRRLGIPARYAVGFAVHEPSGHGYVVRERDAHAWCLVWNDDAKEWQDFDTTPASWIAQESKRASPFQWLSDLWSWTAFQFSKLRWGQSNLRQYVLLTSLPVLAILFYQTFIRRRRSKHGKTMERASASVWPGLDSELYQIEKALRSRGMARQENEPLSEWFARITVDPAVAPVRSPLGEVLRLHYRYRFDPVGLTESDRETLRRTAKACLEQLHRSPARAA